MSAQNVSKCETSHATKYKIFYLQCRGNSTVVSMFIYHICEPHNISYLFLTYNGVKVISNYSCKLLTVSSSCSI